MNYDRQSFIEVMIMTTDRTRGPKLKQRKNLRFPFSDRHHKILKLPINIFRNIMLLCSIQTFAIVL